MYSIRWINFLAEKMSFRTFCLPSLKRFPTVGHFLTVYENFEQSTDSDYNIKLGNKGWAEYECQVLSVEITVFYTVFSWFIPILRKKVMISILLFCFLVSRSLVNLLKYILMILSTIPIFALLCMTSITIWPSNLHGHTRTFKMMYSIM